MPGRTSGPSRIDTSSSASVDSSSRVATPTTLSRSSSARTLRAISATRRSRSTAAASASAERMRSSARPASPVRAVSRASSCWLNARFLEIDRDGEDADDLLAREDRHPDRALRARLLRRAAGSRARELPTS